MQGQLKRTTIAIDVSHSQRVGGQRQQVKHINMDDQIWFKQGKSMDLKYQFGIMG